MGKVQRRLLRVRGNGDLSPTNSRNWIQPTTEVSLEADWYQVSRKEHSPNNTLILASGDSKAKKTISSAITGLLACELINLCCSTLLNVWSLDTPVIENFYRLVNRSLTFGPCYYTAFYTEANTCPEVSIHWPLLYSFKDKRTNQVSLLWWQLSGLKSFLLAIVLYGTVPATSVVSRPLTLVHLYDLGQIPEKQSLRQGF